MSRNLCQNWDKSDQWFFHNHRQRDFDSAAQASCWSLWFSTYLEDLLFMFSISFPGSSPARVKTACPLEPISWWLPFRFGIASHMGSLWQGKYTQKSHGGQLTRGWSFVSLFLALICDGLQHGLRTPNEDINQRNLKIWADVADKICFGRT